MGRHWVERFNGHKLRAVRKEHDWTEDAVAAKVATSREAISNYENNRRKPHLRLLRAIADAFGVHASTFLDPISDEEADMADLRDRAALTQDEVADLMGMSHVTYQRIERRRAGIDLEQLATLAGILNTSTTALATKLKVRSRP